MMVGLQSLRIRRRPRGRIGPIPVLAFFCKMTVLCSTFNTAHIVESFSIVLLLASNVKKREV